MHLWLGIVTGLNTKYVSESKENNDDQHHRH